jgi:hypothetical protein
MNTSCKLITLCLAFTLLSSAFAKPTPHFQNGLLVHEKRTVGMHIPTAGTDGRTGYARSLDKDDWPADMILD